ncbi:MAG: DUF308 domain-containing protein [Ruminococcus sp.]|nr:DUF308 domain-containing protein [Ruminococcus sp.]
MTVLFIILGILLVAGGVSCIVTPLLTFMNTGYFVVILILVFGVFGIIKAIVEKRFKVNFVFSILSILLGIVMLAFPNSLLFAEGVMLIVTAIWFVLMGIVTIINAVSVTKATGSKIWILQLIFGILAVLIGCYSFFQPMLMAISLGILVGIFFIETGFTLIFSSTVDKS